MSGRWLLLVLATLLVAAGCAHGGSQGSGIRAAGPITPRPRPLPPVAVRSSQIKDPTFHVGEEVFITDHGLVPGILAAIVQARISFINETNSAKTIVFVAFPVKLGPIASGGRAYYTPPGAYSIAYHVAEDPSEKAIVQVEPYFDPGEDPAAENRHSADTPGPTPVPTLRG